MSRTRMPMIDAVGARRNQAAGLAPARTGGSLSPAGRVLLDLQRTRGNQHVQQVIQTFRAVGQAGDRYEREADRVSRDVVRGGRIGARAGTVTRPGSGPIPDQVRAPMEQALDADFSRVRVHTGNRADRYNRELQARAFTVGQDIYFRRGAYDPESTAGREVLAHELTHVVQQQAGAAPAVQCKNQLTTTDTDRVEQPISVLHNAFQADFTALGIPEAYAVYNQIYDPNNIDQVFVNGVKHWDRPNRPRSVIATLDGTRGGAVARRSHPPQGLYGHLGIVERAMFGRPDAGPVYEGGHFVSDEILGLASYNEFNFAPQDAQLNSPLWRNFEKLAEEGPHDVNGTRAPSWTYEIQVRYPADYTLTAAELESVGVLPSQIAALNPAKQVTFPRRVPDLWEASLDGPAGYKFTDEKLNPNTHAYSFYTSKATHIVLQSAAIRQGSGGLNLGMESLVEQTTGVGTERFIGGQQKEQFAALQYYPQTIAQQPARTTAVMVGGIPRVPMLPVARPSKLAKGTSLSSAIVTAGSPDRAAIKTAFPKIAGYVWDKALPWAWRIVHPAQGVTPQMVIKKALAWQSTGVSKQTVAAVQKKLLKELARDSNLVL
jgi:hypothetical protein